MEKELKLIKKEVETLLSKVGIEGTVSVEEDQDGFKANIDTKDNALLIGKHGNTLSSLETIISLMIAKKLGEYKRVIIEIGGYRQEREDYLKELSQRLKESVLQSGFEKNIRGLKAWERRVIHMILKDDQEVTTESMGEGRDRVLVIKKK